MGGVEVQSNTYISFDRVWINHSIFVIVIDRLIKDDSLTVSLYPVDVERMKRTLKENLTHVPQYQPR